MSEAQPDPPAVERFTLDAVPPVRPLAIGAGAVVVGAVLLVLTASAQLPLAVGIVAALLMALGLALALTALVLTARLRTEVRLEPESITVVREGRQRSVPWDQVREVTLQHPRLTVATADPGGGLVVVNPRAADDRRFAALVTRISARLDADRGYRELGG